MAKGFKDFRNSRLGPKKTSIAIRFKDDQFKKIDALAIGLEISFAEMVRRIVDEYIA